VDVEQVPGLDVAHSVEGSSAQPTRRIFATSKSLALAEFLETDIDALHSFASDPMVCRYSLWGPNKLEESQAFLSDALVTKPGRLMMAVMFGGAVIGTASVWTTNEEQRIGELGYTLHQDYWGQGLGTEVAVALVDLGFRLLQLRQIEATCDSRNVGSSKVLIKAGLRFVGRRAEDPGSTGGRNETLLYMVESETRAHN